MMPATARIRTEISSLPTIEVPAPKPGLPSDRLQAASIIRMLERLERRIRERFFRPGPSATPATT